MLGRSKSKSTFLACGKHLSQRETVMKSEGHTISQHASFGRGFVILVAWGMTKYSKRPKQKGTAFR